MQGAGLLPIFAYSAVCALCGYLLGSINFAIITTRLFFRQDIRKLGSGNAGMTNVLRNFGAKGAVLTLLGDVGKGFLSVFVGRWIFMLLLPAETTVYGAYVAGIAAVLGHLFPLYFGFQGGKGISTAGGVILALQPFLAIPLVLVFLITLGISGMVSLGSILGISLYPAVTLYYAISTRQPVVFCTLCAAIISLLIIFMHRSNIQRIWNGTEYRFGKRFKKDAAPPQAEAAPQEDAQA